MADLLVLTRGRRPTHCIHALPWADCPVCSQAVCSRCRSDYILADTEDWHQPICVGCWEDLGRPEVEP